MSDENKVKTFGMRKGDKVKVKDNNPQKEPDEVIITEVKVINEEAIFFGFSLGTNIIKTFNMDNIVEPHYKVGDAVDLKDEQRAIIMEIDYLLKSPKVIVFLPDSRKYKKISGSDIRGFFYR